MKHQITASGDVRPCNATVRACRYGESDHYTSKAAAEAAITKEYVQHTFTVRKKKPPAETIIHDTISALPRFANDRARQKYAEEDSVFKCSQCLHPYSNHQAAEDLLAFENSQCRKCDNMEDANYTDVEIKGEYSDIVYDVNNAKKRAWVHATTKDNWYEEVSKEGRSVHVGAPEAAVDRMLTSFPAPPHTYQREQRDHRLYCGTRR